MKNHWSFKLLALILVAVSGFTLAVSGLSAFLNWNWGLYTQSPEEITAEYRQERLEGWSYQTAKSIAAQHLRDLYTSPDSAVRELWENEFDSGWHDSDAPQEYAYTIRVDGGQLQSHLSQGEYVQVLSVPLSMEVGKVVYLGRDSSHPSYEELPEGYTWQSATGAPLEAPGEKTLYYDLFTWYDGNSYRVDYYENVDCQVSLHLTEENLDDITRTTYRAQLMEVTYGLRRWDYGVALCSLAVLVLAALYLSFAAGKKPDTDEIRPRGTNALPLDLFAVGGFFGLLLALMVGDEFVGNALYASAAGHVWLYLSGVGALGTGAALLCTLALTALCAQVRLGKWQWLKRTVAGRILWGIFGWFGAGAKKVVSRSERLGLGRKVGIMLRSVYHNMPLTWQWLVLYALLCLVAAVMAGAFRYGGFLLTAILITAIGSPVVIYTAHGFGKLRDAARRMSQGDLDTKIDTYQDILHGSFAEFAEDLNALGDACTLAAREQMKSERMKSELITNVSHDIKTPLTSIINYVDLLQMAQSEEQRREYLEVLDRQSQRLKKLIEDLMEMSKANSGNIAVELQSTDVIEAVNQALGEFSDALNARSLTVVFRPQGPLMASCDGKLLWRVMSNVLGNVVKYALPGTRVYCDVTADGRKVRVSVKNISRDPLNISAEELMERFVRGDQSRNSEGNGLGLNIAKSLMEVQNGEMELTVDGDLFKVTLILNQA